MKFKHIPLYKIVAKDNVRFEEDGELGDLCASIELFDIVQPILVRPISGDRYEVVSGHRRLEAMKARHEPTIPCYIRDDIDDMSRKLIQIVENSQRKSMSAAEYVEAFAELKKRDPTLTNSKIGRLVGRNRAWVENQYVAMTYAGHLLEKGADPDRVKKMTAGRIIAEAQGKGLTGKTRHPVKDIKARRTGAYTVNVLCRDEATADRVMSTIERLREDIRAEALT